MNHHQIEVILSEIKEELVRLSIADNLISDNELTIIHTVEKWLPDIRRAVKSTYQDDRVDLVEKERLYNMLKELMEAAARTARFDKVVERDENMLLVYLRNQLIEILRIL